MDEIMRALHQRRIYEIMQHNSQNIINIHKDTFCADIDRSVLEVLRSEQFRDNLLHI